MAFSLSKCRILLSLLFLLFFAIFVTQSFHIARKMLLLRLFAEVADLILEALLELFYFCDFSDSKKNACYFCEICYFFYTFLIAVFFTSFLLKLRKELVSKFLLTISILDISVMFNHARGLHGLPKMLSYR